MPITLADLQIEEADHQKFDIAAFDCTDADLNEFLKIDCPRYKNQRLSHTKIAIYTRRVVGFIAVLADSVSLIDEERKWLIQKNVRVQQVPALKVGRLGVDKDFHHQGIGRALIQYSVAIAFRMNSELSVGCRFLTVDAYTNSIGFYERLGFIRSQHKVYKNRKHPNMYYDIVSGPPIG
jgi:ribosomal protein S18 acetylase RimI-like enzyme